LAMTSRGGGLEVARGCTDKREVLLMSAQQRQPVIVGVDGSRDGLIALTWAVRFASNRQCPVRGVHVVDETRPVPPVSPAFDHDDGTDVLEDAADELARLGYDDARFEIRHGVPAQVLLDLSGDATLLVIGRRGAGGFAELVVGSTSQVCAALARAALVVVPDCWQPDADERGRIVVGVDGSTGCQLALDFGFEVARMRGEELVVMHAADVPETYPPPDLWLDPGSAPWTAEAERLVTESLAGWSEKYPEVTVRTDFVPGHPVQVLARESEAADLVVVGGLGRTQFTPLLMGSVSRGLLHHSQCPVAVIHGAEPAE
jgi:nucleotide-binding universal stress UspA family protein